MVGPNCPGIIRVSTVYMYLMYGLVCLIARTVQDGDHAWTHSQTRQNW